MKLRRPVVVAALATVLAMAVTVPAQSEPVPPPSADAGRLAKKFTRLDPDHVAKPSRLPQSLGRVAGGLNADKSRTVDALVELTSPSVTVQAANRSAAARRAALSRVKRSQDAALPRLRAAGAKPYGRISTVLNAIQVRVPVSDLAKLRKAPGVKSVHVSRIVQPSNSTSNLVTGVGDTWSAYKHTGSGRTIGVIDSGLDYTHADFGGPGTPAAYTGNNSTFIESGTFPTAKVTGGYDFVGNPYNPNDDAHPIQPVPDPDPDPLDCNGHGTHVAGTAAGAGVTTSGATFNGPYTKATLSTKFAVQPGAAPQAKLKSYKVFGCFGGTATSVIIAAIDRAVTDRVDVLNISLGSSFGTASDVESTAVRNATDAGVLVVAAVGNDGPGAYLGGSPASVTDALSVAATDHELRTLPAVRITGAETATGLVANEVALTSPITAELVHVGFGCAPDDYAGVAGKIALSTRGACDRTLRATLGQRAGARAVIMINDAAGLPPFEGKLPDITIPFVGVANSDFKPPAAFHGKTVTLSPTPNIANPGYRRAADYSSNGPRFGDSAQKPDLAAPGTSIPSAAVGTGSNSIRISGTSMASPHAAGAAALVRQAHPTWSPRQIKAVLMSTASADNIVGYDSRRLGTGLVQPLRASAAKTYAWTSSNLNSLKFGMNELAGGWSETKKFKVTNQTGKSVRYVFSTKLSSRSYGADFTVSPRKLTVKAGATRNVEVTVKLSRADVAKLPAAEFSDSGDLAAVNGVVTGKPTTSRSGVAPLRVSLLFVPVPLSDIQASPSVSQTTPGNYSPIRVRNAGIHEGTAELYSWLLSDAAGDAPGADTPDVTNVGALSIPGEMVGADPADRLLVFSVSEASGLSTQSVGEIDLVFDTTGDGRPDFAAYTFDEEPDGILESFVLNLRTGEALVRTAYAPANGSTVQFVALASELGITASTGAVSVFAAGWGSGGPDETAAAAVDFYRLPVSHGDFVRLKPGQSATVPVAADPGAFGNQAHPGWLVISEDDKAGLREADRVRLIPSAPVGQSQSGGR